MKTCSTCAVDKPLSGFVRSKIHKDGYHGVCKDCRNIQRRGNRKPWKGQRRWYLDSNYGLSINDYNHMLAAQEGLCAVCKVYADKATKGQLFVDHDHKTGKVRGLLCGSCNSGIGYFRDDAELMRRATAYIAGY